MRLRPFIKENFALCLGLFLPLVLMAVFFLSTAFPRFQSDPPQYDMLFSVADYSNGAQLPVSVNFVVKEGRLFAQYIKQDRASYQGWRKLYLYEAKTKVVRQLPFEIPQNTDFATPLTEQIVETTQSLHLDPSIKAPDGYYLSSEGYSRSGLVTEILWGNNSTSTHRLRKDQSSLPLFPPGWEYSASYGNLQFIGWVRP